jgi:hypothetical protein
MIASNLKLENLNDVFLMLAENLKPMMGVLYEKIMFLFFIKELGEKIDEESKTTWKHEFEEVLSACESNSLGLPDGISKTSKAILLVLQAQFYEVILKDSINAGYYYELANEALEKMTKLEIDNVTTEIMRQVLSRKPYDEQPLLLGLAFRLGLPRAELISRAGDAYYKGGDHEAAFNLYKSGLTTIEQTEYREMGEEINTAFARLYARMALSIINIQHDDKEQLIVSFNNAAEKIFFTVEKKDNETYRDLCALLEYATPSLSLLGLEPEWLPLSAVKLEGDDVWLLKLKAELGERAFSILNDEFTKTNEFPLQAYFLVATVAKIYVLLGDYEKSINFIEQNNEFKNEFYDYAWTEILQDRDWAYGFINYINTESESRGLLRRPGFQEIATALKESAERTRETLQRVELKQTRIENKLDNEPIKLSYERIEDELSRKYVWLGRTGNKGSIVNAKLLSKSLKEHNWAEVISGYCNAVEAELKQFIYKEYLSYLNGVSSNSEVIEKSQRQLVSGSVLYTLAHVADKPMEKAFWDLFLKNNLAEEKEFLNQLPNTLQEIIKIRNPSAHGIQMNETAANRMEEIVMGNLKTRGLMDRLDVIRQKYTSKTA